MFRFSVLGVLGILVLSTGSVWADLVVEPRPPTQEKVLSGKLDWEKVKRRDGTTVRGRLLLTTGNCQVALPVTSGCKVTGTHAGGTIDVGNLVGKRVKLTAKVIESRGRRSSTRVLSVTRIEEESPRAARPVNGNGQQLADTKTK